MTQVRAHRIGHWLPTDQKVLDEWLAALIDDVHTRPRKLHPVVDEFRQAIEDDSELYMLFHRMFDELPNGPPYDKDPTGAPQVRDYQVMLKLLSAAITRAPEFNKSGSVGLPINTILDWPMGTGAGRTAFHHPKVNLHLRQILGAWARFLDSPDSTYVLSEDPRHGWFGEDAMAAMPDFDALFQCDPRAPHRGFRSWDAFFTREFRTGVRPIAEPDNDRVIINACESAPYKLASDVKAHDRFWIKSQPYSLTHMLAADPLI